MAGTAFPFAEHDLAHYDFKRGASIHEHDHPEEEVYEVIEGEQEMTIDGLAQVAHAGLVAIVMPDIRSGLSRRARPS